MTLLHLKFPIAPEKSATPSANWVYFVCLLRRGVFDVQPEV